MVKHGSGSGMGVYFSLEGKMATDDDKICFT